MGRKATAPALRERLEPVSLTLVVRAVGQTTFERAACGRAVPAFDESSCFGTVLLDTETTESSADTGFGFFGSAAAAGGIWRPPNATASATTPAVMAFVRDESMPHSPRVLASCRDRA